MADRKKPSYQDLEKRVNDLEWETASTIKTIVEGISFSEKFIENFSSNAFIGVFSCYETGLLAIVSNPVIVFLGYSSQQELMSELKSVFDICYGKDDLLSMRAIIKSKRSVEDEVLRLKRKDGRGMWVNICTRVSLDESGNSSYKFFLTDISKLLNDIPNESEETSAEKIKAAMGRSDDILLVIDHESNITDANLVACAELGYTREELLKMTFYDVDYGLQKEHCRAKVKDIGLSRGQFIVIESSLQRKDGSVFEVEGHHGKLVYKEHEFFIALMHDITKRKETEHQLRRKIENIKELTKHLQEENYRLKQKVEVSLPKREMIGEGPAIKRVLSDAKMVARQDTCVLILGETGTGKELLARAIHDMSPRYKNPMIKVNCAALPATLIESELFGREKGAYTGAVTKQVGRFEAAHESTIFLDEIGDLPIELQAKLLRVLQDKKFERLGSLETISVDARVIAATNHDLSKLAEENKFRKDLYYRLNVFPITIPPLRERKEDIPLLVWSFVEEFSQSMGKLIRKIPEDVMHELQNSYWAGNVRELKNTVERAMIRAESDILMVDSEEGRPQKIPADIDETLSLKTVEKNYILKVLEKTDWRVRGPNGAAELLDLKPTTLDSRMQKLGIRRPK